jgi:hypothetical protein
MAGIEAQKQHAARADSRTTSGTVTLKLSGEVLLFFSMHIGVAIPPNN